jgi:type II secretory pathway component GspD/PulD (secretin)
MGLIASATGFSADARSNRLVIRCPPSLAEEINSLVRELDAKPILSK